MKRDWKLAPLTAVMCLGIMLSLSLGAPARAHAQVSSSGTGPVRVWETTADQSKLLQPQPDVAFQPAGPTTGPVIDVNEHTTYQRIAGFGAALTDSSAWVITHDLTMAQRADLMAKLFSPTDGIGLNYVRVPMGSSDFTSPASDPRNYTYDDLPAGQTDPNLDNFSIGHDRPYIIPVLLQAKSLNPDFKIMATPWSAPGWMKINTSSVNPLFQGELNPDYYGTYANYFIKFVQAYEAAGVPVASVTVQNEPHYMPAGYAGMGMESDQEAAFVGHDLGPAFAAANLPTKIIVWDHNWDEAYYPIEVESDPTAAPYIDGSAFHCYAGTPDAQTTTHEAHPDKAVYFTECTDTTAYTNFGQNLQYDLQNLVIGGMRDWSSAVIRWNIALDDQFGPNTGGGCTTCTGVVTVNHATGAVTYNEDYYALGHASKFVFPGAYRIASTDLSGSGLANVAFRNPDGSKALLVTNSGGASATFTVRWGGATFPYTLPAGAVATFTWSGTQDEPAAPSAPANVMTTPSAGLVRLDWDFSPLAGSYTVKRAATAGGPYTTIASGLTGTEYRDSGLTDGTPYYYQVSAVNAMGGSAPARVSALPNPQLVDAFSQIEAQNFDWQYRIRLEQCHDTGCKPGDQDVGNTNNGHYVQYNNVNFGMGAASVQARVASGSSLGGNVEFHLDSTTGPLIATVPVTNTGGWQTWVTLSAPVSGATGIHTLYLVFTNPSSNGGITNVHWFQFTPVPSNGGGGGGPTATPELGSGELLATGLIPLLVFGLRRKRRASVHRPR